MSLILLPLLAAFTPLALAQEGNRSNPEHPGAILGPQLIAWSDLQTPKPLSPDQEQSQNRPASANGTSANSQASEESQAETFDGAIVRDGDRFILSSGDRKYQLDDQERARKYAGKQVRIKGTVDADRTHLRILNIELVS